MPALALEPLATLLASRLDEAQRQQLAEAPRAQRLAVLGPLLGLDELATLKLVAETTGIGLAVTPAPATDQLRILPSRLAHEYQILPIALPDPASSTPNTEPAPGSVVLKLASLWPPDAEMIDWIGTFTSLPLEWHLTPSERLHQLIVENYGVGGGSLEESDAPDQIAGDTGEMEADEDAAVVRFVTDVINQAVIDGATDIHVEPQEEQLRIRYRVDGLLVPVPVPDNLLRFQDAIISRLKIMARLNISERRLPQDGRINFRAGDTNLDIRVSTIPTIYAESVSLRLLNQRKEAYSMEKIGLSASEQGQISHVLDYPHGLVLVTGPTGSGKSTSLNAFLRKINSTDLRIITIEDPIEYEVPGANQMQTRAEIGLTFASALRHVLRQDPDVIMVGEIRDLETAEIAIRASLTGHLVFSTLHTNDATGAITRLVDMGVEPFLVASAVELVIAQRLVRRLCSDCACHHPVDTAKLGASLVSIGLPISEAAGVHHLNSPVGCQKCRHTGYRGRIGIFEILQPRGLHDMIVRRESNRALADYARTRGMITLPKSGWEKVKAGYTTLDELLRVITTTEP